MQRDRPISRLVVAVVAFLAYPSLKGEQKSGDLEAVSMTGWIHHIDITVSDMRRSTDFYHRVLPLVGFRRLADCADGPVWAGATAEVGLQEARSRGPHDRHSPGLHHLAFGAPSRETVDELWRKLEALGVEILDPPADYDEYAPGYYAVFFADPDGMKLEYVFTPEWPV